MRIAFYSHDTMGLGHIRRNLAIARSLLGSGGGTALLITGTREATAFPLPPGCECLALPSLMKDAAGRYQSRSLDVSLDEIIAVRGGAIRAALASFVPDMFIVDKVPRGVHGELEPALELLRARGATRCVLGLRDVLDEPASVAREWRADDNSTAVNRYYDAIWVYGDPRVYDLIRSCPPLSELRPPISYTGYLSPNSRDPEQCRPRFTSRRGLRVLCLVGGGQDGAAIARAFAACSFDDDSSAVVVTGPFMPAVERRELETRAESTNRLRVSGFLPDIAPLIEEATHVVAMGGYNTICELLRSDSRVLIVPRIVPRREQAIRAERLSELGLVDVLHPDHLHPRAIEAWLRSDLASNRPVRGRIDLEGLSRLPELVRDLANPVATPARACS